MVLYRSVTNIIPLAQLFFKRSFWVRIEVMHFNETIKILEVKCQFTVRCDIQDEKTHPGTNCYTEEQIMSREQIHVFKDNLDEARQPNATACGVKSWTTSVTA